MRINKISNYSNFKISNPIDYARGVNTDLTNLFLLSQGRVRFGTSTNATFGENISGEFLVFTTPTATNSEFNVTHGLGTLPMGWLVASQSGAGDLYTATGANSTTKVYFRSSATSTNFTVFLLK